MVDVEKMRSQVKSLVLRFNHCPDNMGWGSNTQPIVVNCPTYLPQSFSLEHLQDKHSGHKVGEQNSLSFLGFSRVINLLFHRLSQQKVNVIMTFVNGHSTSTPAM